MSVTAMQTIGQIATEHPLATRVFARHGIDFCCGGGQPLTKVCEEKGLEVQALLDQIHKEIETSIAPEVRWDEAPVADLIDHILTTHHRHLDEELPRLESMARKVLSVHGDKHPEMFEELVSVFSNLRMELEQHMGKEEQILFPMILQGRGSMAEGPMSVMRNEHDSAGDALRRLRELTNGYEVPEEACNTWRALWAGLAALESSLHEHIHLENNILFPRALAE